MNILSRIKNALRGSGRDQPNVPPAHQVSAAESPFGVEGWDCRAFTHHMVSTTGNAEIAQRYVQLRSSRGDEYRGKLPVAGRRLSCNLSYRYSRPLSEGPLFKSEQMEDKWDIYLFDNVLYFARSWTGELLFCAEVVYEIGRLHLTAIVAGGNHDPAFAHRVVDYLVKSHLQGRDAPHPLPTGLPPVPDQIAAFSFSMFGRRCSFGTYTDTTITELDEP